MHIKLPDNIEQRDRTINREELEAIFEKGGKYPSIKEQLVLKAHEITSKTKVIYDSDELSIFIGADQTGHYLSCFNKTNEEIELELPLKALNINNSQSAYCVLTATNLVVIDNMLTLNIPDQGILLVKLSDEE